MQPARSPLIIVGASARAAAFSAHRAGYAPYWLDRFGDEDLRARFPGRVMRDYPKAAPGLAAAAPAAPFIFTGALENHPDTLAALAARRRLLGNPAAVCDRVRDPRLLFAALRKQGLPVPRIQRDGRGPQPPGGWLLKPRRGAGGMGVTVFRGQPVDERHYLQEYLAGDSFAAVFAAAAGESRLLGVTRQLVGLSAFHAAPFSYCGSIGPLRLGAAVAAQWRKLGATVAARFGLAGLFGIDAIRRGDSIYPVEVNPRYTASVEVLEPALDCRAVALHCAACAGRLDAMPAAAAAAAVAAQARAPRRLVGKACLFAPRDLRLGAGGIGGAAAAGGEPGTGRGLDGLYRLDGARSFALADVPLPGTEIPRGHPILTVIVSGAGAGEVRRRLESAAATVYDSLAPGD